MLFQGERATQLFHSHWQASSGDNCQKMSEEQTPVDLVVNISKLPIKLTPFKVYELFESCTLMIMASV